MLNWRWLPNKKAPFQKIGEEERALRGGLAAVKTEGQLRAKAKHERRQEAIWRLAAEASEAELTARVAARRGVAPAPAVFVTSDPSPTPEPTPDEEVQDGPQAALTRQFFQAVYGGRPPKKLGYRALHERMKDWIVEKNKGDQGSRVAASETTVRIVRKAF